MSSSNNDHPECKPGEVFLRNDGPEGFRAVKAALKSARQGTDALNIHGALIKMEGYKPIFCDKEELERLNGSAAKVPD